MAIEVEMDDFRGSGATVQLEGVGEWVSGLGDGSCGTGGCFSGCHQSSAYIVQVALSVGSHGTLFPQHPSELGLSIAIPTCHFGDSSACSRRQFGGAHGPWQGQGREGASSRIDFLG